MFSSNFLSTLLCYPFCSTSVKDLSSTVVVSVNNLVASTVVGVCLKSLTAPLLVSVNNLVQHRCWGLYSLLPRRGGRDIE